MDHREEEIESAVGAFAPPGRPMIVTFHHWRRRWALALPGSAMATTTKDRTLASNPFPFGHPPYIRSYAPTQSLDGPAHHRTGDGMFSRSRARPPTRRLRSGDRRRPG